jgi:predicted Zn-dependent protease with MMP-like domain
MSDRRSRRGLSADAFAALVQRAIADLPPDYAKLMETIAVVVEEEPPQRVLDELELDSADDLLGLYQGHSLADESFFQSGGTAPAQISIYRGPILRQCENEEEIVQEVYDTVVHELGHHVGLDDDEMPY